MKMQQQQAALIKHGFIYKRTNKGTGLYCAEALDKAGGVSHGFSTREGGITVDPPKASLNLSWTRCGSPEEVIANFKIFAEGAGIDYDDMAVVNHEHGANVLRIAHEHRGRGFYKDPLPPCDGIITDDPTVTLVTSHADCGAYFFYDPVHRAIGMAHAGWKGTLLRIGAEMARRMAEEFDTDPSDIIAATGPCICRDCFEVDADLLDFAQLFRIHIRHIDGSGGLHLQALLADEAEDRLAYRRDGHVHFPGQVADDQALAGFVLAVDERVADFVVNLEREILFLDRFELGHGGLVGGCVKGGSILSTRFAQIRLRQGVGPGGNRGVCTLGLCKSST